MERQLQGGLDVRPGAILRFRWRSRTDVMARTTVIRRGLIAAALVAACSVYGGAQRTSDVKAPGADDVPQFEFDGTWPNLPLPNQWIFGNVAGVHVDEKDQIWILHRPLSLGLGDDYAVDRADKAAGGSTAPPNGECCRPAPSVVVFDIMGRVVKAWGGPDPKHPDSKKAAEGYEWPREHSLFVDYRGNVWLGCEEGSNAAAISPQNCATVTKFTNDGKLIFQKGHFGQGKGNADTENFNSPAGIFVDPKTNEAFIADGYRNRRVIVIDADTGAFKRMWGAYGDPHPPDIARDKYIYNSDAPPAKVFGDPLHCVELSQDDLVYVCDRENDRIQVFKKDGTFVKEAFVAPKTHGYGTVHDIGFSKDPDQRFMYVADGANHKVWMLRRSTLAIIGSFGHGGRYGGELGIAHQLDTDSKGNVYVGETVGGDRVQRFKFVGMKKRS